MHVLAKKLTTAKYVFQLHGTRGVLGIVRRKLEGLAAAADHRARGAFETWRHQEHWWVGALVELRGDVVTLDSCTFRLRHPAIATSVKSLLLLDAYEKAEREILPEYLDRSLPVVELGGSIGVVACVTNRMLDAPEKHVVVEANPDLIGVLEDNRARNGCAFSVLNRAVGYGCDQITFYKDRSFLASSVQAETSHPVTVPAITMRQIVDEYGFDRCTLICDIEGGEMDLVRYDRDVLRDHVATLIVEIHGWRVGQPLADEMTRTLHEIGFRSVHERGATQVFRNTALVERCGTATQLRRSGDRSLVRAH